MPRLYRRRLPCSRISISNVRRPKHVKSIPNRIMNIDKPTQQHWFGSMEEIQKVSRNSAKISIGKTFQKKHTDTQTPRMNRKLHMRGGGRTNEKIFGPFNRSRDGNSARASLYGPRRRLYASNEYCTRTLVRKTVKKIITGRTRYVQNRRQIYRRKLWRRVNWTEL